jgi:uncharacterized protein
MKGYSRAVRPVLAVSVLLWIFACGSEPRVVISTKEGKEFTVQVEIADTPAKRELGLQYRRELPEDQGMLFLFPSEQVLSFWMKNTPISLDMLFINSQRKIVGIIHETVPFSTTPLSVAMPSQVVLEILGGLSRRRGISAGDSVSFQGIYLEGVKE